MEKKEYIEAIEKMNSERIQFYHSNDYKIFREKVYRYHLRSQKDYYSLFLYYYQIITDKIKKRFPSRILNYKSYPYIWFKEESICDEILEVIGKKKKVVYTCIIGDYDQLLAPVLLTSNTDYILFTDNLDSYQGIENWKVYNIPSSIQKKCNGNSLLINRYIKMHPHELFPDYDYALYVDGNIEVVSDMNSVFEKSNNPVGISMHLHHKRIDLYDEGFYCISRFKGNRDSILKMMKRYQEEGFPLYYGLCEACVISVDLKNANSIKILNDWWKEFLLSDTGRDQISFPYVLWKNHFFLDDMRFLGRDISTNPQFFKNQHFHEK